MSSKLPKGKKLAELCFTRNALGGSTWTCFCGARRVQNGTGYSNLVSHVQNAHGDYLHALEVGTVPETREGTSTFCWSSKTKQLFAWLDLIVMGLLPFSFCDKPCITRNMREPSIAVNTLKKYMIALTTLVESKISDILPDKFAVVLDGWSAGDTHYIAIFATFPQRPGPGFRRFLLAFSPMGDETRLDAAEHKTLLDFVLSVFGKTCANVVCISGDNCSTNKSFASLVGCRFQGCVSHRFNLAVKDFLSEHTDTVTVVRNMMKKLRNLIPSAKLRGLTHLKAKVDNVTRWSSSLEMLLRYQQIRQYLHLIDLDFITENILKPSENKQVDSLCASLRQLDSIAKALQCDNITVGQARTYFDTVIFDYPQTTARLSANAEIVKDPTFESAVVKLQTNRGAELTTAERDAIKILKTGADKDSNAGHSVQLSLAERARKKCGQNSLQLNWDIWTCPSFSQRLMCARDFSRRRGMHYQIAERDCFRQTSKPRYFCMSTKNSGTCRR